MHMKKHTYIVTFKRKWIIFAIEDVKQSNKCNCISSTLYMYIISSVKNVIVKKAQLTKICPANYFLHERLKLRLFYVVCKHIFIRCFLVCLCVIISWKGVKFYFHAPVGALFFYWWHSLDASFPPPQHQLLCLSCQPEQVIRIGLEPGAMPNKL